MNPNGKKIRDHRIGINLNHYEYQLIEAYCQLLGIDKSTFVRKVLISHLVSKLVQQDRIALLLPGTATIQFPLSSSIVPAQGVSHA